MPKRSRPKSARKKTQPKTKPKIKSGNRCWGGYKPVPGKKPYSKGSCRKV